MTFSGANNEQYQASKELGKGGEGIVFDIANKSGQVLKKYIEPLTADKSDKLKLMVSICSPDIEAYAAWPVDIISDTSGAICGFVMKKLTGYVPLHTVFSPMDRKRLFPDKGYNFLIHVARNLATAFHKLHEAGLVIGDVNEGNILINANGFVSFIDCDSFQIRKKDSKQYYYCEVGVPRYTPPELLKEGTFEHVVRTVNTDSFSLAILIFQLLFLGRHPFAGKNTSNKDIDEETAIRQNDFAYSLSKKRKKLTPPTDSFDINNLPENIIELFHRAFEQKSRPKPAEWIGALDELLANITTCSLTKLHTYPSKLTECPWCQFRKQRGILYFLDDSYLQANIALQDIENFVNVFKVEKLVLKQWIAQYHFPNISATPIEKTFINEKRKIQITVALSILTGVSLCIVNPAFILIAATAPLIVKYSNWSKQLHAELERRTKEYLTLKEQLTVLEKEFDHSTDIDQYNKGIIRLQQFVSEFRELPQLLSQKRSNAEEGLYHEQLNYYLACFKINDNEIPSFGSAKKNALINCGILSAADITGLKNIKVPGIGPKNYQVLLSWQRQVASGFLYIPDSQKIAMEMQRVDNEIHGIKLNLESNIRHEYQTLNYLKHHIFNRISILENQITQFAQKTYRAELDLNEFKKAANIFG